jgi:hypothetical protein
MRDLMGRNARHRSNSDRAPIQDNLPAEPQDRSVRKPFTR